MITEDRLREIIALDDAKRRDWAAMVDYLGIGETKGIVSTADMIKMSKHDDLRGPEAVALRQIVKALPESDLKELAALMWFGRGDGSLADCRTHAARTAIHPDYVLGKPLAKYLSAALGAMNMCRGGRA